jgi:RHS repeat-associated protein
VIDALGKATTFAYDAVGNQTTVTDALGNQTSLTYDDAGRPVTTTLPDGTTTSTEYDALGRRVSETDHAGRVTRFGYDPLGRIVQVTDAVGVTTRYAYDKMGNRISQIDANGHTTRFTYDQIGRQTSRILPDGATETFAYDAVGNVIRRTDFNGVTTTYTYDVNDRVTRRTYPDGISVTFTYTATGRRSSVTDSRGVTTYTYDDRDRLIAKAVPEGWTLRYAWDASGNRIALTADLGDQGEHTTSYAYDALGRMTTVTDARGSVYAYGYDAAGRPASLGFPNGVVTTYLHDAVGRLVDLHSEALDGSVIQDYAYTFGRTGNRQSVTEQDGTVREWEYDELYQLISEKVTDGDGARVFESSFTYDPMGNRIRQVRTALDAPTETITYAYDVRDRLLTETTAGGGVGVTTYSWDMNGNLVAKSDSEGTTIYRWDVENRLLSVELPDGTVRENSYNADGVRLTSNLTLGSGGTTPSINYVSDTSGSLSQVIVEMTTAGVLDTVYPRGLQLLGLLRTEEERYAHSDHLGSVRALTEPTSSITDSFNYEAFGTRLDPVAGHESPYLFAGEQRDPATGLYYLRARWMSPMVGQFLSLDPLKDVSRLSRPLPAYTYADSDPIGRLDPSGRSSVGALTISIAVAVAVAVAVVTLGLSRPLAGGAHSNVKTIRPIVLEDPAVSWSDAEIEMLLSYGRSVLSSRTGLGLVWRGIERRENLEAWGHIVEPTIDTGAHLEAAIWQLWYEAPRTLPVVFVTSFDFRPAALGVSTWFAGTAGPRGSAISRYGMHQEPRLVVAHELVHSLGLVEDRICVGPFGYLMDKKCGYSGDRLFSSEVIDVRFHSLTLR